MAVEGNVYPYIGLYKAIMIDLVPILKFVEFRGVKIDTDYMYYYI